MPHQPIGLFGIETLIVGLIMFLAPLVIQVRFFKADTAVSKLRKFIRFLLTAGPSLPIVGAGILLMIGRSAGLYGIAVGVILSLMAGVLTTWVLLIEILR